MRISVYIHRITCSLQEAYFVIWLSNICFVVKRMWCIHRRRIYWNAVYDHHDFMRMQTTDHLHLKCPSTLAWIILMNLENLIKTWTCKSNIVSIRCEDVMPLKQFPRYWFSYGFHHKGRFAVCIAVNQAIEQTVQWPVIWDAATYVIPLSRCAPIYWWCKNPIIRRSSAYLGCNKIPSLACEGLNIVGFFIYPCNTNWRFTRAHAFLFVVQFMKSIKKHFEWALVIMR